MKRATLSLVLPLFALFSFSYLSLADEGGSGSGYGKPTGVAGPITMAPTLTVIGFPSPFRFGFEAKALNLAGLGFDYGFLPSMTFSNVKIKYNSWRITGRVYPFRGAFFVGLGFGKQNLSGSSANSVTVAGTPYSVNYSVDVNTTILVPHIGWRWIWSSGFFLGMEYGVQVASSSTSTFSSDAPSLVTSTTEYTNEKNNIEEQGRKLGRTTLPHIGLIQLGYFF